MVHIRPATPDDVPGLAAIIQEVWQMEIDPAYCRQLLASKNHFVEVVAMGEDIVAFVASFITTAPGNIKRWEVDLIAVTTSQQNSKLGQKLLTVNWEVAQQHQVNFARGLIGVNNIASQKAFIAAGYSTTGEIYNMYLWSPRPDEAILPARGVVNVQPVETLTYRGLWLEGLDSPLLNQEQREATITGARAQAAREGRANCSTLLPATASLPNGSLDQATLYGQYQWWRRPG